MRLTACAWDMDLWRKQTREPRRYEPLRSICIAHEIMERGEREFMHASLPSFLDHAAAMAVGVDRARGEGGNFGTVNP